MAELEDTEQTRNSENAPKHLSLQENVFLTLKVLALAAILGAMLWFGSEAVTH